MTWIIPLLLKIGMGQSVAEKWAKPIGWALIAIGAIVHRPLSQVPENTLKYVVGLILTSFGIFWTGEGLGAEWPGQDLALLGIFAAIGIAALAINSWARTWRTGAAKGVAS